jgi:hypothetical protein
LSARAVARRGAFAIVEVMRRARTVTATSGNPFNCDQGADIPHLLVGATGVVIPERRSAEVTPAVCKASAGAVEHLPVADHAGELDDPPINACGYPTTKPVITGPRIPPDPAPLDCLGYFQRRRSPNSSWP